MIETFPTAQALADAAAREIALALIEALGERGQASLVATGGRSPGPVYDRLCEMELDWTRVAVTLSDERCVPPDDPASNERLVRTRLLRGRAAAARFVPLWPLPPPADLQALMPFDVTMLGMGEDGHIASLLPGDPDLSALLASTLPAAKVPAGVGDPPLPRVTLTLSALLASRGVFLLIAGEAKRQVVSRALAGEDLPVRALIAPRGVTGTPVPVRIFWAPAHEG